MAIQTLAELLGTRTLEQVRAQFSAWMTARAATAPELAEITEWVSGGVLKTLLELDAETFWRFEQLLPELAKSGFVDLASGTWLDFLAQSQYNLTRAISVFAIDSVTLTAQAGSGPYTITDNQLWAVTANGLKFQSMGGGTLPTGGTLVLQFIAEHPGTEYNLPRGVLTKLLTPLSGVTISNSSARFRAGADTESDARLRQRCKLRWAELAAVPTSDSLKAYVLAAAPAVTKISVADNNPRGAGTADVVVSAPGGVGVTDCTDDRVNPPTSNTAPFYGVFSAGAVNAYLQARRGLCSSIYAYPATITTITITATIQVLAGFQAQAEPRILANLTALQNSLEIGGLLRYNNIIDALLEGALGTVAVVVSSPTADVQLSVGHDVVIVPDLTWVEV